MVIQTEIEIAAEMGAKVLDEVPGSHRLNHRKCYSNVHLRFPP